MIKEDGLLFIGLIVTMWGQLSGQVNFMLSFWSLHPHVPEELHYPDKKLDFGRRIAHLRKVAPYYFANGRANSCEELERIFGRMMNAKSIRDDLVHGSYALKDNEQGGQLTVHGKRGKRTFRHATLLRTVQEISECAGALMDFDNWAHHSQWLETHNTLQEMMKNDDL